MANMSLDFRHSSPISFRSSSSKEPYSFAADHGLSEREASLEELEASVKETPPRPTSTLINGHLRNSSEPRSLYDVMDEGDKMLPPGSPSLRHTKGRLENDMRPKSPAESYADVTKHEPSSPDQSSHNHNALGKHGNYTYGSSHSIKEEDEGIATSDSPKSVSKYANATKPETGPKSDLSFADVVKHEAQQDSDGHGRDTQEHPAEQAKESTVKKEDAQQAFSLPDIPKNDPVKKEHTANPDHPKGNTSEQEGSHRELNLPDLPEHDPTASSDSYANVVKHEPTSPVVNPQSLWVPAGENQESSTASTEKKDDVQANGHDADESSTDTKSTALSNGHDSTYGTQQDNVSDSKPGSLIYENYESRSGTNLASIALGKEYELAMSQRENKSIPSTDSDEKSVVEDKTSGATLVSGRRAGAGWSRSAVRWAPLNVPLQRRLQTLAVLAHSLSIASFVAIFFALCAIPIFWPIIVPYLVYLLLSTASSDGKLAHRSEYLRRLKFWSLFASYFPARLHRSVELEPHRKYIFGYHPHGIISHGAFAAFVTEALGFGSLFPGITNTLLTLDSNFRIPIYRDWILRLGLASVARESCENLLSRGGPNGQGMGRAITIVVGGARESLDAKPGTLNLVLAKRKGFVKLAVRTGADLVPVLAFGENDMYEQIDSDTHPWIHKWQLSVKRFMGFTLPLFHARGIFNYDVGIMPYRRPINIVVGRPIKTEMAKNPDPAYVDELHKQYTDELLHIWSEWKDTFAPDRKDELQIIE